MIEYVIRIFENYSGTKDIVICQRNGDKMYVAKKVELVFEELKEGYFFNEPTISISWYHANGFMKALKEALDTQKLPEGKLEGQLEATKKHLEDMRTLVFDLHGDKDE